MPIDPPDRRGVPSVIDTAIWEFEIALKILAQGLRHRTHVVGDSFSVVDILAGHTLLWPRSARLELGVESLMQYLNGVTIRQTSCRAKNKAHLASVQTNLESGR